MKSQEDIEAAVVACETEAAYYQQTAQEYLNEGDSNGREAMLDLANRALGMKRLLKWVLADGVANFDSVKPMADALGLQDGLILPAPDDTDTGILALQVKESCECERTKSCCLKNC